ncbi:MAG TPA: hypothetical protein VL443_18175, partial [Cyclobacteriaceae bacterium]|nr:hypothetical protein [Cyclobacteriaceae bacterium]
MKKLLFLLLLPALAFGQNYTERPLPAKKPYAQVFGYIEHVPSNAKLPILIALTGFGENPGNGRTDIYRVLNPGLGSLVRHNLVPV